MKNLISRVLTLGFLLTSFSVNAASPIPKDPKALEKYFLPAAVNVIKEKLASNLDLIRKHLPKKGATVFEGTPTGTLAISYESVSHDQLNERENGEHTFEYTTRTVSYRATFCLDAKCEYKTDFTGEVAIKLGVIDPNWNTMTMKGPRAELENTLFSMYDARGNQIDCQGERCTPAFIRALKWVGKLTEEPQDSRSTEVIESWILHPYKNAIRSYKNLDTWYQKRNQEDLYSHDVVLAN